MKYALPQQAPPYDQKHCHQTAHAPADVLYVVTSVSNPHRYASRYKLYRAFEQMCADNPRVQLHTVELAQRDRYHEVTSPQNPRHIQLRSPDTLWHKENLLNLAIQHLPAEWEYVAWIDADVSFARPDWAEETLHALQIHKVVQMWEHATDLGPQFQPIHQYRSFMATYRGDPEILDKQSVSAGYVTLPPAIGRLTHSGFAWAARRSAIADLGGLGEIGILGSGDRHMSYALVGKIEKCLHQKIPHSYNDYWIQWQERATRHIQGNVGFVPGLICHHWHGKKQSRGYKTRWRILVDNQFDYLLDLKKDPQGVWALTDRNPHLRDDIVAYFGNRNEDSIDL